MDELSLLARSLPDAAPPSDEVFERARARLSTAMDQPVRTGRPRLIRGWTLAAAAATVAVITTVIALVSNLAVAPVPMLVPAGGNDALLSLADQVARLPDDTGAYWRRSVINNGLTRVRAGGKTFNVLYSAQTDLWQPRDPRDPVQLQTRQEFMRPATPADERAWRAAGSPEWVQRVCTPGTRAQDCKRLRLRTKPWGCVYTRAAKPGGVFGDRRLGEFTLADLAALPGDAAQLREKLHTYWEADRDGRLKSSFDEYLSWSTALLEMPVRPAVKAAALRLVAGLPTTKVSGPITDPLGRAGLAVAFVKSEGFFAEFGEDDEVAERYTTILDPWTGAVLATNASIAAESTEGLQKGTFMHYTAWASETGWTDDRPERPRDCKLGDRPIP
ncbi:CU044_5270 family protein [Nonomuraea sp. H19]|uniref:CU044_5270 family protein n=1 Tax=Nonomuraea sp. H19 TaxID=3452206 RepID=UPI003F8A2DE9